jgi:hypothetical protein
METKADVIEVAPHLKHMGKCPRCGQYNRVDECQCCGASSKHIIIQPGETSVRAEMPNGHILWVTFSVRGTDYFVCDDCRIEALEVAAKALRHMKEHPEQYTLIM